MGVGCGVLVVEQCVQHLETAMGFRLKDQRDVVDKSINYPSGFQV